MTAHELDQPRMIYTGALPPHLNRLDDPPIEDEAPPLAQARRPGLPLFVATAAALTAGIAIGVFAPPLFRSPVARPAAPAPQVARLSPLPSPIPAAPDAASAEPPEAAAAQDAPPHTQTFRLSMARLEPAPHRTAPSQRPRDRAACATDACNDPAILEEEADLQQAYGRAVTAGAPADALRSTQIEWLLKRDEAGRRSPAALASAYRQRIAQLNAMADVPPY